MPRFSRRISRRRFLRDSAVGAGALAIGGTRLGSWTQGAPLPPPPASGIDHVVVLMMENRSFDHYLGWLPGADGRQAGLVYVDDDGSEHETYALAPDYQGCGHPDPDHSYAGGRIQYNGGACDGWLRSGASDEYAIGYYTADDLDFFAGAAEDWTTCDRYFSSILAATFPNRMYMHAAQTDRLDNSFAFSTLPTIWDRLELAGLRGRYYFNDVPFLALWGAKYVTISRPYVAFLQDCAAGTLPEVAFVEPRFIGEEQGLSTDDHPHADVRNGQAFMNEVYSAIVRSPAWHRTLFVITYDEWGGFFDHVPPPTRPIPDADVAAGNLDGRLGFRVPTIVISPFAQKKAVSNVELEHTSILKFIEWRWGLDPLTIRDATATNLADILEFGRAQPRAPRYRVRDGGVPTVCLPAELDKWATLLEIARGAGWGF
jgi:phospholipase C